jgi:hypothetical protein
MRKGFKKVSERSLQGKFLLTPLGGFCFFRGIQAVSTVIHHHLGFNDGMLPVCL